MRLFYPFIALAFYILGWFGGHTAFTYDTLIVLLLSGICLYTIAAKTEDLHAADKFLKFMNRQKRDD